jgi:hypothetical protein
MEKKKYSIGFTYTKWVDVEAIDAVHAIDQAVHYDLKWPDKYPLEIDETADPIVYEVN